MASRNELKKQKEETSRALITAALDLCAREGYASLTLRSVSRKAGIAPTSFYRHFREIDEMGVEMIVQAKEVLDECLAAAGKKMAFPTTKHGGSTERLFLSIESAAGPFVVAMMDGFKKHGQLLHLFFQERTGSSDTMRRTIREAADELIKSLADTLKQLFKGPDFGLPDNQLVAELMLAVAGAGGMEMLFHPEIKPSETVKSTVQKIKILLLGAIIQGQMTQE